MVDLISKHNNFLKNLLKKTAILLFLTILSNIINQSNAFAVGQANKMQTDPKYGNAQNEQFINAMYGLTPNINTNELPKISNRFSADIFNKFFIRLGGNSGSSYLTKIKNTSTQPEIKNAKIANNSKKANPKYSGEISIGYKLDRLSFEVEFIITENMKYSPQRLFNNFGGSLSSTVKANGIFLNGCYDFVKFQVLRIYLGLGFGAGINRTNSNFYNNPIFARNENFARRRVAGGYNLLLGCKINIVPQLFIVGSVRYTNFAGFGNIKYIATSNVEWRDEFKNLHLEGQHTFIGYGINIIHVFA
jgi:opacity protein-like surface antigen